MLFVLPEVFTPVLGLSFDLLCSTSTGFSLPCLLFTTILDSFPYSNYLTVGSVLLSRDLFCFKVKVLGKVAMEEVRCYTIKLNFLLTSIFIVLIESLAEE